MRQLPFAIGLLLCLALAQAQNAGSPAQAAASTPKVQPISLRPTDLSHYPVELSSAGVQGATIVRVKLDALGAVTEASVEQTSRSAQLDEAAVVLARTLSFKVREGGPQVTAVLVPVEFLRDSVSTLGKKSCAEFNTDAAYFAATFPEVQPKEMKAVSMAIGVLFMAQPFASTEAKMAFSRSLKTAIPRVFADCASRPDAGFLESFRRAILESGG